MKSIATINGTFQSRIYPDQESALRDSIKNIRDEIWTNSNGFEIKVFPIEGPKCNPDCLIYTLSAKVTVDPDFQLQEVIEWGGRNGAGQPLDVEDFIS